MKGPTALTDPTARGFTLIEVIVALTLFAIMGGIIFSSLQMGLISYERSQDRIEEAVRHRALLDLIKRQLGSLYPLRPTAAFASQDGGTDGGDPVDSLMQSQVPLFFGTESHVTFITVAPQSLRRSRGLSVVTYGLAEDEYGDPYLGALEIQFTGTASFLMMADPAGLEGKPLTLIPSIDQLAFEYYGFDPQGDGYHWFSYWSGDEMQNVPLAIRIHYNESQLTIPINANFPANRLRMGIQNLIQQ